MKNQEERKSLSFNLNTLRDINKLNLLWYVFDFIEKRV